MTNKPMLSVERELLATALKADASMGASAIELVNGWAAMAKLRALLDKPVVESQYDGMTQDQAQAVSDGVDEILHGKPADKHQGEPVVYTQFLTDVMTAAGLVSHGKQDRKFAERLADECARLQVEHFAFRERPAPVADHTQCEECKGWGYHENLHEGGGTECGECGGSGNAPVAVVMPDVDELAQIIRKVNGSHTLGAGSLAEAILEEVARLNGVKS